MGSVITCLHMIRKNPYACIIYSTLLIVLPVILLRRLSPIPIFSDSFTISFSWSHTRFPFMVSYKYMFKKISFMRNVLLGCSLNRSPLNPLLRIIIHLQNYNRLHSSDHIIYFSTFV